MYEDASNRAGCEIALCKKGYPAVYAFACRSRGQYIVFLRESDHHYFSMYSSILISLQSIRPIAQAGGYFLHMQGIVDFLAAKTPRRLTSCYETMLFQKIRLASIILGLALGKWTPFATKKWMSVSKSAPLITSETRLLDIGVNIPNLLAGDHHEIRDSSRFPSLDAVQQSLSQWIQAYQSEKGITFQPFQSALFPDFARLVTFNHGGQVPVFSRFSHAFYLSLAWTLSFVVQSAQFLILVNSFEPKTSECESLEVSLAKTARLLCSTIPQFFDKSWGFSGRFSINLFLQMLVRYYQSIGDEPMVGFCFDVKCALGRPQLGQAIVTDHKEMAFERYFSTLRTV